MPDPTIDWTDETLRPLDELARLAFPDGGVTGKTLRLRARQGKLAVYRPGKAYLSALSGVRAMIEKTRVHPARTWEACRSADVPNSLGLTAMDLANTALDQALQKLRQPAKEAKRLRHEERTGLAPAHRLEMQERRGGAGAYQVSTKDGGQLEGRTKVTESTAIIPSQGRSGIGGCTLLLTQLIPRQNSGCV
jgi:hypothetical protein